MGPEPEIGGAKIGQKGDIADASFLRIVLTKNGVSTLIVMSSTVRSRPMFFSLKIVRLLFADFRERRDDADDTDLALALGVLSLMGNHREVSLHNFTSRQFVADPLRPYR